MRFGRQTRQRRAAAAKPPRAKYYQSSTNESSSPTPFRRRPKRSRSSRVLGRLFDFATVAGILILVGYSLIVRPPVKVSVSDEAYHPAAEYQQAVNGQLDTLKNKNKITFDEQSISETLKKQFPEIADLNISLPLVSQQPILRISVYSPTLTLSAKSQIFIVDSQGRAVGFDSDFTGLKNLITVTDESNFEFQRGQAILAAAHVDFIVALNKHLKKAAIPARQLSLTPQPQELVLRTADRSYFVRFLLNGDLAGQIGQYLAARAQFDRDNTQPSEYLDVRVAGKVFYK